MSETAHVHGDNCQHDHAHSHAPQAPYVAAAQPGRNDPCPCGSQKKYKKCCLGASAQA